MPSDNKIHLFTVWRASERIAYGPWLHPVRKRPSVPRRDLPAGWWLVPSVLLGLAIWSVILYSITMMVTG